MISHLSRNLILIFFCLGLFSCKTKPSSDSSPKSATPNKLKKTFTFNTLIPDTYQKIDEHDWINDTNKEKTYYMLTGIDSLCCIDENCFTSNIRESTTGQQRDTNPKNHFYNMLYAQAKMTDESSPESSYKLFCRKKFLSRINTQTGEGTRSFDIYQGFDFDTSSYTYTPKGFGSRGAYTAQYQSFMQHNDDVRIYQDNKTFVVTSESKKDNKLFRYMRYYTLEEF